MSDSYIINGIKYIRAKEELPEPKKARVRWISPHWLECRDRSTRAEIFREKSFSDHICFHEVMDGDISITRRQLAEAWRNADLNPYAPHFTNFCNTLGFK